MRFESRPIQRDQNKWETNQNAKLPMGVKFHSVSLGFYSILVGTSLIFPVASWIRGGIACREFGSVYSPLWFAYRDDILFTLN